MANGDQTILTVIVVIAVVFLLLWLCGAWGKESMKHLSKEKSMRKEVKHMADAMQKMAADDADRRLHRLSHKMKKLAHKMKRMTPMEEKKLTLKMRRLADEVVAVMGEEAKIVGDCLRDMAKDLVEKESGGTREGFYYYGPWRRYYRPRWRYWRYYRPYRFYRPYYYWGGYW